MGSFSSLFISLPPPANSAEHMKLVNSVLITAVNRTEARNYLRITSKHPSFLFNPVMYGTLLKFLLVIIVFGCAGKKGESLSLSIRGPKIIGDIKLSETYDSVGVSLL